MSASSARVEHLPARSRSGSAPPSAREQTHALDSITGPERLAVLIGPAGAGKDVVIDAAARAEQLTGRDARDRGLRIHRAASWRGRPGARRATLALDALIARSARPGMHVGPPHDDLPGQGRNDRPPRLEALTEMVEQSGAKLIAVGDGAQLPSIGAGGMFDRLSGHAPNAALSNVRRTPGTQRRAARPGEPARRGTGSAMAHYVIADGCTSRTPGTRPQPGTVQAGQTLTEHQASTRTH